MPWRLLPADGRMVYAEGWEAAQALDENHLNAAIRRVWDQNSGRIKTVVVNKFQKRRNASEREKKLGEAHEMLMKQREASRVLVDVVRANTRALAELEAGQRALVGLLTKFKAKSVRR